MLSTKYDAIRAVIWAEMGVQFLDQRRLPEEETYQVATRASEVAEAITKMVVRGAPAIGIAAAYGVVLAARARFSESSLSWRQLIEADLCALAAARPTAVNLFGL